MFPGKPSSGRTERLKAADGMVMREVGVVPMVRTRSFPTGSLSGGEAMNHHNSGAMVIDLVILMIRFLMTWVTVMVAGKVIIPMGEVLASIEILIICLDIDLGVSVVS